jgi:pimeloyl-ACP methyl ester carboxylesterase
VSGPSYFGPEGRRLFGWLSAPPAGVNARAAGVVLCNPFGFEALSMHRAYRHFAESFARAGFPALRFDYDGTGDSSGTDRDPERLRAWLDSIHAAAAELRARAGVRDVHLFGVRLGATLAATAAAERDGYAGLIGVVPVLQPAILLRELAALQDWAQLRKSPDGVTGVDAGDQEAAGFVITAPTIAELSAINLARQTRAPARCALVLDRSDRPGAEAWAARLRELGVDVTVRSLAGFLELNVDPHKSVLPESMIAAATEWLATHAPDAGATGEGKTLAVLEAEIEPGVVETALRLGESQRLFAIVTSPKASTRSVRAVLALNAGAQHRIGPNRLWVAFARRWARLGVVTMRLDLSGLGDTPPRPGTKERAVYGPFGALDIAEAATCLREAWGARTVEVLGLCSGGYHAIKAAAGGAAIDGVVSINQEVFFWDPTSPEKVTGFRAVAESQRYREAALSLDSWRKLLRGQVHVQAASRIFRRRIVDLAAAGGRILARDLRIPLPNDLATELRTIAKRNVQVRFLISAGEPVREMLVEHAGGAVTELEGSGAIAIETAAGPDHTFTAVWTHQVLEMILERMLVLR